MTERPSAGVLAGIVALCFVAAFAAAAVLRPQTSAPPAATAAVPLAGSEAMQAAPLARSAMSREAALPRLRLPVHRRHRAHKQPARPAPRVAVVAAPVATPVPTPVVTAVPTVAPVTPAPPVRSRPTTPNVGQTFDSSG
jgi:hypothetical protein